MSRGIAKIDEQPIPEILGDMARVVLDDLGSGFLIGPHHSAQVFRVKLARQLRGAHQVAEQHGKLSPFRVRRAVCQRRGADWHGIWRV
jgi:hypothetical protein